MSLKVNLPGYQPLLPPKRLQERGKNPEASETLHGSTPFTSPIMQTHQKPVYPTGYAIETAINAYKASPNDPHQPSSMPIYQTSTFIQPSANELQEYDYTRSANPTRTALEILVSGMEGSDRAFAFTSGMSALACMTRLLKAGDEILCNADIYGGMYRILSKITTRQGVAVKFVKSWELDEVRSQKRSGGTERFAYIEGTCMRISSCWAVGFELLASALGISQMSAATSVPTPHPAPLRPPHDASRDTTCHPCMLELHA